MDGGGGGGGGVWWGGVGGVGGGWWVETVRGGCDRCVSIGGVRGAGERKDVSGGGSWCDGGGVCGSRWCSRCGGRKACER